MVHTRNNNSTTAAALVGFALGSTATLVGVWLASKVLWDDKKNANNTGVKSKKSTAMDLPAEIREEQLSRHTLYFGEQGMARLKDSSIVVVGVGGVGSHIAHMVCTEY